MIEKKLNEYNQLQIIDNFDKLIKIGDRFLQVRLIKTNKFKASRIGKTEFTEPMPRAKFVNSDKDFYYLVRREDIVELKRLKQRGN